VTRSGDLRSGGAVPTCECQSIGTFAYAIRATTTPAVALFYSLRRRLASRFIAHGSCVASLADHSSSSRRRRSSARHGSPFNSRRSAPITKSSAVAVDVPADAGKHGSSWFARRTMLCSRAISHSSCRTSANGCADRAHAVRRPTAARDSADRRAGQQGSQPSRVPVTAWCVCFRLLMRVSTCHCIYVQYK